MINKEFDLVFRKICTPGAYYTTWQEGDPTWKNTCKIILSVITLGLFPAIGALYDVYIDKKRAYAQLDELRYLDGTDELSNMPQEELKNFDTPEAQEFIKRSSGNPHVNSPSPPTLVYNQGLASWQWVRS